MAAVVIVGVEEEMIAEIAKQREMESYISAPEN